MIASTATGHASVIYSGALSTNIPLSPSPALAITFSNSPAINFSLSRVAGYTSNPFSYGAFAELGLQTGVATQLASPSNPDLTAGQLIDGALTFQAANTQTLLAQVLNGSFSIVAPPFNFPVGQHYLGFKYTVADQNYFGWTLIDITEKSTNNSLPLTATLNANLLGYAFESCANTGITAGATSGGGCDASATPEPSAVPLLTLAGGASALAEWRRRKKQTA